MDIVNNIDISESDMDNASLSLEMKKPGGREILLDNGSKVILGLPDLSMNNTFEPPNIPHVFQSDMTLVREGRKTGNVAQAIERGILPVVNTSIENDPYGKFLNLGSSTVIFGHAVNRGSGSDWSFGNNQNVPETVLAFNRYAKLNNLSEIELVAACNADPKEVDLGTNQVLDQDNEFRVGAFGEQSGSPFGIAYVVGELAKASGRVDDAHGVIFNLETEREGIFNIDTLIAKREYPL